MLYILVTSPPAIMMLDVEAGLNMHDSFGAGHPGFGSPEDQHVGNTCAWGWSRVDELNFAMAEGDGRRSGRESGTESACWQKGVPSQGSWTEAAKPCTTESFLHASCRPAAPAMRASSLAAIRQMLVDGYTDMEGNQSQFRSLHHLQRVRGRAFEVHFEKSGLNTLRSLWLELQTHFPGNGYVAMKMKHGIKPEMLMQVSTPISAYSD